MCTACEWAPHFAAYCGTLRSRSHRAGGDGITAHTHRRRGPVPPGTPARRRDFVFRNGPIYTVVRPRRRGRRPSPSRATRSPMSATRRAPWRWPGPRHQRRRSRRPAADAGFRRGPHPSLPRGVPHLRASTCKCRPARTRWPPSTQYATDHPDGPVRGFGWRVDMFGPEGPTRADLDRVLPDRPGFFFAIDGHSLWVNSKALEIAGVTREPQDPIPGFSYYVRDAARRPHRLRTRGGRRPRHRQRHRADLGRDHGDAAELLVAEGRPRRGSPRSSTPGCRPSAVIRAR